VLATCAAKQSISPETSLPPAAARRFTETRVQVVNQTTLQASRKLVESGHRPLALNFANGIIAGGGFLTGSRAQEEVLCRSSALYETLVNDPMYDHHAGFSHRNSSDWAILSPDVPVFRNDDGSSLNEPWNLSFISSAAPICKFPPARVASLMAENRADPTYAGAVLQAVQQSALLLRQRIHRVLSIAEAYGYETLVLGAWGCGAFHNDPARAAVDFRQALEHEFRGAFSEVVFAITDWSNERRFLGPFRDVFSPSFESPTDEATEPEPFFQAND
jgi:uncharacterized protein (TIGR02452 family)